MVPRITRSTCWAIASSLPSPFCTDATQPPAKACAVASAAADVCIAFVATIPKSHGGSSDGVRRRANFSDNVPGAGEPEPVRVDRVDVLLREVVGPDLDVVELRQVRREQRPDRAAADDADPQRRVPSGHGRGLTPDMLDDALRTVAYCRHRPSGHAGV